MAIRKIPQRKCVGCNTSKDKKELISYFLEGVDVNRKNDM